MTRRDQAAAAPTAEQRSAAREIVAGVGIGDMPEPADPMAVARELLAEYRRGDAFTLRHHRGDWTRWDGPAWSAVEPAEVTAWLYRRLEPAKYQHFDPRTGVMERRPWRPNRTKVAHVVDALAAVTHLPGSVDPPAWIGDPAAAPAGPVVACTNGLLHVDGRRLTEHTPDHFNVVSVPFGYDDQAPAPARWLAFLDSLWPDDPDAVAALQEWFGYVLSGRTELHKILLLVGPPRSGKGTIARVLSSLLGAGHVANPTLASLGTNFGIAPLIGRPLAVIGDARLGTKADPSAVVERLLSISGEDGITVDRKHRDAWTGRLPTRFVILSNELPRLGDASGAVATRFLVLTLTESYRGREDLELGPDLERELPGIMWWALDGLDRLARRRRFAEPQSSRDAVDALRDLVSPVSAFVRDCCEIGGQAPVTDVWETWRRWADANGHPHGSTHTLSRNLRAALPALRTSQPRGDDGKQVRHYVGLHLRPGTGATVAPLRPVPSLPQAPSPDQYMRGSR